MFFLQMKRLLLGGFFYTSYTVLTSLIPIFEHVCCAGNPHAINTTPLLLASCRSMTARIACAVKVSHPLLAWDAALCARTVRLVFNQRTPAFASGVRSLIWNHGTLPKFARNIGRTQISGLQRKGNQGLFVYIYSWAILEFWWEGEPRKRGLENIDILKKLLKKWFGNIPWACPTLW